MQRLHRGLAQHFNQDAGLPIRLFVEGHREVLILEPNGDMLLRDTGLRQVYPKTLKELYLNNPGASTEELIQWLESHSSILIRIKKDAKIYN